MSNIRSRFFNFYQKREGKARVLLTEETVKKGRLEKKHCGIFVCGREREREVHCVCVWSLFLLSKPEGEITFGEGHKSLFSRRTSRSSCSSDLASLFHIICIPALFLQLSFIFWLCFLSLWRLRRRSGPARRVFFALELWLAPGERDVAVPDHVLRRKN